MKASEEFSVSAIDWGVANKFLHWSVKPETSGKAFSRMIGKETHKQGQLAFWHGLLKVGHKITRIQALSPQVSIREQY
jgi:hypothetical protein